MERLNEDVEVTGQVMRDIFSAETGHLQWRQLWLCLVEVQQELGLAVSEQQLEEIRERVDEVNYGFVALKVRDYGVGPASHLQALMAQCPKARPVLGLGVDNEFVLENSRAIRLHAALERIKSLLLNAIAALADVAEASASLPGVSQLDSTLSLGQLVSLWLRDLLLELEAVEAQLKNLRLPGCQWSHSAEMAKLLGADNRLELLDSQLAARLGFPGAAAPAGPGYMERRESQALSQAALIADCCDSSVRQLLVLAGAQRLRWPDEMGNLPRRISVLSRFAINLCMPLPRSLSREEDPGLSRALCALDGVLTLYIRLIEACAFTREQREDPPKVTLPFLYRVVDPLLEKNKQLLGLDVG